MNPTVYLYDLELRKQYHRWIETVDQLHLDMRLFHAEWIADTLRSYVSAFGMCERDKVFALSEANLGLRQEHDNIPSPEERRASIEDALGKIAAGNLNPARFPHIPPPRTASTIQKLIERIDQDGDNLVRRPCQNMDAGRFVLHARAFRLLDSVRKDLNAAVENSELSEQAADALGALERPLEAVVAIAYLDEGQTMEDFLFEDYNGPFQDFMYDPQARESEKQALEAMCRDDRLRLTFQQRLCEQYATQREQWLGLPCERWLEEADVIAATRAVYRSLSRYSAPIEYLEKLVTVEDSLRHVTRVFKAALDNDSPMSVTGAVFSICDHMRGPDRESPYYLPPEETQEPAQCMQEPI